MQNTKNGKGVLYPYFICARRQRLHDCSFKAVLIEVVEAQMQEVYRRLYVSEADRQEIERYLLAELARIEGGEGSKRPVANSAADESGG